MTQLLVLGLALSLDNFRTAIALGILRPRWMRAVQVALTFGVWDGLAPLAGLVLGNYVGDAVGPVVEYVGPAALGAYGTYLVVHAIRTVEPERVDQAWALFGIPLTLSLDNLLAGASLGLVGFSPPVSAAVLGSTTVVMSLVGLQLGRVAARVVHVRCDLLSGVALVSVAAMLALG